jgi:hypothetical protein
MGMKTFSDAALLVSVVLAGAGPAAAQQADPFERSAMELQTSRLFTRENTRRLVAAAAADSGERTRQSNMADWSRVRRLTPGATIQLATETHPLKPVQVIAVDSAVLVVLNIDASVTPKDARVLRQFALAYPAFVRGIADGRSVSTEHVSLSPNGVFVDGRRIGDADRLFEWASRDRVTEILAVTARGSDVGTCLGMLGGLIGGLGLATLIWNAGGPDQVGLLHLFGGPIVGGILGRRAGGVQTIVIYRR